MSSVSISRKEDLNQKEKLDGSAIRLLVFLGAAIFTAEFSIMLVLHFIVVPDSALIQSLIDSILLVIVLYPLLYLLVIRSYLFQNVERARAEVALRKAHDELETLVEARTAELVTANEGLRNEVAERTKAEEALLAQFDKRKEAEQENQRSSQIQATLSAILRVTLMDLPLEAQLDLILGHILSVHWLALESKGCIFLIDGDPQVLVMKARRGLDGRIAAMCAEVPFGRCICGRAASSGEIEFAGSVDRRHENLYDGLSPHGHYCVPIRSAGKVFGVVNLYVREGYRRDDRVEEFLLAVADTLAGIIERKRAEEALRKAHGELELRVAERTEELARANEELRIEIAERIRAVDSLAKSEERFRAVAETASDAIVIVDSCSTVVYWNHAAEVVFGYRASEILGQPVVSLIPERLRERQIAGLERVLSRGYSDWAGTVTEGAGLRRDGSEFPAELTFSVWRTKEGLFLTGMVRDITQRKEAEENLTRSLAKLKRTLEETIEAMALTVEMRDPYTAGHQRRVTQLATAIAREMGFSEEQISGIRMAASIHDIGKISVPAEILSKPGRLSDIEFSLIKTHSQAGYDILKTIRFPWPIGQMVYQHHERMNGSGYPLGLAGEDILLEARILGVADVVEAMASYRPYRPALGIDSALAEISGNKGSLYDPAVVMACLRVFTEKGFAFEKP